MTDTILVPLDGSSFAEHALPLAVSVARRAGATLHIARVHVPVPPPAELEGTPYYDAGFYSAVVDRERDYMNDIRKRLLGLGDLSVEIAMLNGPVPDSLRDHAEAVGARLVVLGTHGYEGLRRLLQHGLADRMLRRLRTPVLAVRPPDEEARVDLDAEVRFRHILVPLDGSVEGEGILEHAIALGRLFEARYTLLRVASPADATGAGVFGQDAPSEPRRMQGVREQAETYLSLLLEQMRAEALPVEGRVAIVDEPARAILEQVTPDVEGGVDLIAMATRARKGLARLVRGSIAGDVLQESPVPALLHYAGRDQEPADSEDPHSSTQ